MTNYNPKEWQEMSPPKHKGKYIGEYVILKVDGPNVRGYPSKPSPIKKGALLWIASRANYGQAASSSYPVSREYFNDNKDRVLVVHYHCPECDALHREGLPESWIAEDKLVFVKKKNDEESQDTKPLENDYGTYRLHVESHPCTSVQGTMIGLGEDETANGILTVLSGVLEAAGINESFQEYSVRMRDPEVSRSDILVHDSAGNILFVLSYHSD